MAPYFSIILPVYNVERYLQRCVRSVLEQSFQDYEIILVDDGSSDSSGLLCDEIAGTNPNIRVIHKENGGLASARNAGLEEAAGQYIWFVDSDDFIEPQGLQVLYEASCKTAPDMVKFNYFRVTGEKSPVISNAPVGAYDGVGVENILLKAAFFSAGRYVLSACTHIYKRELLKKSGIRFLSERLVGSEDYLFNLEIMAQAQGICVIGDILYNYEQRAGSLTQQYKKDLSQRYEKLYEMLLQRLPEKYGKRVSSFYLWHLLRGTCIPNAYYDAREYRMAQRREAVKGILKTPKVKKAYRECDKSGFAGKKRIMLWAVGHGKEPIFYWLYVIKPSIKKGKTNEN